MSPLIFAKEAIKKANGDPKILIDLRYKEYLRLANDTKDPKKRAEYAANLNGWKARLKELSKQVSLSEPDQVTVEASAAQLDQQYPGAGEELLALHKSTTEKIEQSKKLQKQEFLDSVMPRLYETNGDWSQLSSEQKAKAIELDVWKDVTAFTGRTNPQVGVAVAQMTPEQILSTDFTQPHWRTKLSQTDYEVLIKNKLISKKSQRRGVSLEQPKAYLLRVGAALVKIFLILVIINFNRRLRMLLLRRLMRGAGNL